MSYQALFGAFPIAAQGSGLDPKPNALVGELRGSSRNGAFFRGLGDLLNVLPQHACLRFVADESGVEVQREADGVQWTILDEKSTPPVIAALDSVLQACEQDATVLASAPFFRDQGLTAQQIQSCVADSRACLDVNAETPGGEDGDSPGFLFATLRSLRGMLVRARRQSERIAFFTWSPQGNALGDP